MLIRQYFQLKCWFWFVVAATFLWSGRSLEANCRNEGGNTSEEMVAAVALLEEGWSGSDSALKKAVDLFEVGRFEGISVSLVQAYRGSSYIAYARLVDDREKVRWLKRGAQKLEAAVRREPKNVAVRLLRIKSYAILPKLAGKWEVVLADAAWLLEPRQVDRLSGGCRYEVFYQTGSVYLRDRNPEALRLLAKAIEVAPTNAFRERALRLHQLATSQFPTNIVE